MSESILAKIARYFPIFRKKIVPHCDVDLTSYVEFPEGFVATNPSLLRIGDRYLVCVRGVNYTRTRLVRDRPRFTSGTGYRTLNRFALVDLDFAHLGGLGDLDGVFDDVEDIRLFSWRGETMAVGSSSDPGVEPAVLSVILLRIDPDVRGGSVIAHLRSPLGHTSEKNWAPFVYDDELYFVYSFDPLVILKYDESTRDVVIDDVPGAVKARRDLRFFDGGSSAGIAVPGGFLFATHRRRFTIPARLVTYLSRIYFVEMPARKVARGPYFRIREDSIQFINGLDVSDDDLILSLGIMDRRAHVCRIVKKAIAPRRSPVAV